MRSTTALALLSLALLCAPAAQAAELVTNGGFQNGGSEVADGWDLTGYAWVMGAATATDWTGGHFTTRVLNLGGVTGTVDTASQTIATAGYGSATLSFDLLLEDVDPNTGDFFSVSFGGVTLESIDIAALPGDDYGDFYAYHKTYDISAYLDGTPKTLTFTGTNDLEPLTASDSYIDNVSIQARAVPEPAPVVAMALGSAAFLRRRRAKPQARSAS